MPDQVVALPTPRARELRIEINALREARDCATGSDGLVIYGRIDSLISGRESELSTIFQRAREADLERNHRRG